MRVMFAASAVMARCPWCPKTKSSATWRPWRTVREDPWRYSWRHLITSHEFTAIPKILCSGFDFSKCFSGILVWHRHRQFIAYAVIALLSYSTYSWYGHTTDLSRQRVDAENLANAQGGIAQLCHQPAAWTQTKVAMKLGGVRFFERYMDGTWMDAWCMDGMGCLVCPRHWRKVFFFAGHGPLGIFLGVKGIESRDTWRYRMDLYGSVW